MIVRYIADGLPARRSRPGGPWIIDDEAAARRWVTENSGPDFAGRGGRLPGAGRPRAERRNPKPGAQTAPLPAAEAGGHPPPEGEGAQTQNQKPGTRNPGPVAHTAPLPGPPPEGEGAERSTPSAVPAGHEPPATLRSLERLNNTALKRRRLMEYILIKQSERMAAEGQLVDRFQAAKEWEAMLTAFRRQAEQTAPTLADRFMELAAAHAPRVPPRAAALELAAAEIDRLLARLSSDQGG